jgi:hypothetical protein
LFYNKGSRVRRSPLKKVENLNFVPLNLHIEQFVVDNEISNSSEKRCYEFTTVGAFTTAHTNKLTNMKPIEQLMMNDKPFEFNNNAGTKQNLIENTIVLHFYSLKVFIQILNELATINEKPNPENEELIQFEDTTFKANSSENQVFYKHHKRSINNDFYQLIYKFLSLLIRFGALNLNSKMSRNT